METVRAIYEVQAGLIPGESDPDYSRQFIVSGRDWGEQGLPLLLETWHKAIAYATYLQILCADGRAVNWVRIEFVWP